MELFHKGDSDSTGSDPSSTLLRGKEESHDRSPQPASITTPPTETKPKVQTEQMTEYVVGLVQRNREKIIALYPPVPELIDIHFAPQLPAQKVANAIEKYAPGMRPQDILVLIDTTAFKSGKTGALITRDRIYTNDNVVGGGQHCFPFTEITSVALSPNYEVLQINDVRAIWESSHRNQMVLIAEMLRQISEAFNRSDCQEYLTNLMSHIPCRQCGASLIVFAGDTMLVCQSCRAENHLASGQIGDDKREKGLSPQIGNEITLLGNIAWDVAQRTIAKQDLDSRTFFASRLTPELLHSALGLGVEIPVDEQVIVLMCDTLSGDAKEGLLLTDKRVYELHQGRVSKSMALDEVREVDLSFPPGVVACIEINKQPFFTAYNLPPHDVGVIAGALLLINQERQERQSNEELIKFNSHDPREIIDAFRQAIKDERIFLSPDIPPEKLKRVLSQYGRIKEDDVLGIVDRTDDGSAKANLTITADKIFSHRKGLFEVSYQVIELRTVKSIEANNRSSSINLDGAEIDTRTEANKARLLALMIEKLCRTLHPAENPLIIEEEWPGANSTEQVRSTTCIGCGSSLEVKIADLFLRCQYCGCERLVIKSKF